MVLKLVRVCGGQAKPAAARFPRSCCCRGWERVFSTYLSEARPPGSVEDPAHTFAVLPKSLNKFLKTHQNPLPVFSSQTGWEEASKRPGLAQVSGKHPHPWQQHNRGDCAAAFSLPSLKGTEACPSLRTSVLTQSLYIFKFNSNEQSRRNYLSYHFCDDSTVQDTALSGCNKGERKKKGHAATNSIICV